LAPTSSQAALGRELTEAEEASVETVLEEATDLLTGFLGCAPDPVPDAVKRVTARMVARVFSQALVNIGASQVQETAGPFSRSTSYAAGTSNGSPWLAAADKLALRPFRCGGGLRSVALESDQSGRYRHYT
jgi:hypothetical protein